MFYGPLINAVPQAAEDEAGFYGPLIMLYHKLRKTRQGSMGHSLMLYTTSGMTRGGRKKGGRHSNYRGVPEVVEVLQYGGSERS